MPTYQVTIGQREYRVQIADGAPILNGEVIPCQLTSLNGNGMHQLSRGHQSVEIYLSTLSHGIIEAYVEGRRIVAQVGPAQRRPHRTVAAVDPGSLLAPMPGLIAEVLVQEGESVESGQVIAVEESMKMQMQLRAPCAGHISHIAARPGAQVDKGSLVLRIVPA
jgi:biotin carboxyl carrier protein